MLITFLYYLLILDGALMLFASQYWMFDVLVNFIPQFSIAALGLLLISVMQRKLSRVAILALAIVYFVIPFTQLWIPEPLAAHGLNLTSVRNEFSIMQVNVNYTNTSYQELLDIIAFEEPTIITLNEVQPWLLDEIDLALGSLYPYAAAEPTEDYRGVAVLSKIPIDSYEVITVLPATAPVLRIDFKHPSMTLYALHALSPISASWSQERDELIRIMTEELRTVGGNLIVSGDFNTTMHGSSFKPFIEETFLNDSRRGFGWEPSWMSGTPAAVAIDHILYRGLLSVTDFRALENINSDHRPIIAHFIM